MTDEELNLLPDVSPDIVPEPTPEPTPEPVPEPDPTPVLEVISVDELLDRLTQGDEPSDEDPADPGTEETPPLGPGDTPAVELGPDTLVLQGSLDGLGAQTDQLTALVADIQERISRPALTTSFEEYTVTEALLLLLLLFAFAAACARMLRGGFSWLRS